MNVAGIDPGLSGGIAIISEQGVVLTDDLPIHHLAAGKKVRAALDLTSLRQILVSNTIDHVVLERVAARPGQGVASMFRFGHSAGSIYGLIIGLQLPVSHILPQQWQKLCGVGPTPDAARRRAAELYPCIAERLTRKRDAGRADAILIAHAGLQRLQREF